MSSDSQREKCPARGTLGVWLFALRAPFLTASALPVLVGSSAAYWKTGNLAADRLLAAVGGVVCLHLGANLTNDYFDYVTGCDDLNPQPTPYSGGSRVIQHGLIPARAILAVAWLCFALGAIQGLWLWTALRGMAAGNAVLWLGLAGLGGGILYSAVPFKLSYRGAGEIIVFTLFGPMAVAGGYCSQTGSLGVFPFLVAVPAGLLVLAVLLVNEVLDYEWDGLAGKRTVIVRLGGRRGYDLYLAVYFAAYAWIAAGMLVRIYPPLAGLALAPLAAAGRLRPRTALADRASTVRASGFTVISHTLTAGLIAAAYFVGHLL